MVSSDGNPELTGNFTQVADREGPEYGVPFAMKLRDRSGTSEGSRRGTRCCTKMRVPTRILDRRIVIQYAVLYVRRREGVVEVSRLSRPRQQFEAFLVQESRRRST
jgi:hypothetical protein